MNNNNNNNSSSDKPLFNFKLNVNNSNNTNDVNPFLTCPDGFSMGGSNNNFSGAFSIGLNTKNNSNSSTFSLFGDNSRPKKKQGFYY